MKRALKIIPILTAMILLITSCGGKIQQNVSIMQSDSETMINIDDIKELRKAPASQRYSGGEHEPSSDLSHDLDSYQIQIYDDIYTFPMKFSNFMSYGWEIDEKYKFHVQPQRMARSWFRNGDLRLCFYIYNPDITAHTYTDCYVNGMTTFREGTEADSNIFLPGGCRFGTNTRDDFLANSPQADKSTVNSLGETFVSYTSGEQDRFIIRFDTQGVLNAFELEQFTAPEDFEATEVNDRDFVNKYKAPKALGSNPRDGIISINSELYRAPVPLSAFIDNGWEITDGKGSFGHELIENTSDAVSSGKIVEAVIKKGRKELSLLLTNPYDDACYAENCILKQLPYTDLEIELSGKLSTGMSEEELVSVLKNAEISYDKESDKIHFNGSEEYGTNNLQFVFSISDGKVENIDIKYTEGR